MGKTGKLARKTAEASLTLQSLLFSNSLLFSFSDFPSFFVDFRGSAKRKTLVFFRVSLFQKTKGWRVRVSRENRKIGQTECCRKQENCKNAAEKQKRKSGGWLCDIDKITSRKRTGKSTLWTNKRRTGLSGARLRGRTLQGGRSRHLLETPFSEPLLRTLLRTLFYCKTHRRPPSQNPSENPFPRTLPRTFSEPFSERCVAVRPLRRAP